MEYYVVANKDKAEYMTYGPTFSWGLSEYRMTNTDLEHCHKFTSKTIAQSAIQNYVSNRMSGDLENYQILKIRIDIVIERENLQVYNKDFKFSYTTSQNEDQITKEEIAEMLKGRYGIERDFDYKFKMTRKHCRTHVVYVDIKFKD